MASQETPEHEMPSADWLTCNDIANLAMSGYASPCDADERMSSLSISSILTHLGWVCRSWLCFARCGLYALSNEAFIEVSHHASLSLSLFVGQQMAS